MFKPDYILNSVADIDFDFLARAGIRALILDIDNTLAVPDKQIVPKRIYEWIERMKQSNIKLVLLSNNSEKRISDFAEQIGVPFVAKGGKPLKGGYIKAAKKINVPLHKCAAVGDQIFTDIWGGNNAKIITVLTKPFCEDQTAFIKLKRRFERLVLR